MTGYEAGVPGYGPETKIDGTLYRAARQTQVTSSEAAAGVRETWGVQIFDGEHWRYDRLAGTSQFPRDTDPREISKRLLGE